MDEFGELIKKHQEEQEKRKQENAQQQKLRQMEEQKQQYEERIATLTERATERYLKHGEDDDMYQLLEVFLNVALEMKEMMDKLTDFNMAFSFVFDAIQFFDESLNFDMDIMEGSLETNYGVGARWRRRREMRRAIRNNKGRVKQMVQNMQAKYKMAITMSDSMVKAFSGFSKGFKRKNAKRKKKKGALTCQRSCTGQSSGIE